MDIEFQRKAKDSGVENCPARYKVTSAEGGFVIQGKKITDPGTRAQARQLADDEDLLWIPADLMD